MPHRVIRLKTTGNLRLRPVLQQVRTDRGSDIMRYQSNEALTAEEAGNDSSAVEKAPQSIAVDENPSHSEVGLGLAKPPPHRELTAHHSGYTECPFHS